MAKDINDKDKENKTLRDVKDNMEKENEELKEEIKKLNVTVTELNSENDVLNQKVKELECGVQQYESKINEFENIIKTNEKKEPSDKNQLFSNLFKSFNDRVLLKPKIDTLIGMYMKQKERNMQVRYDKLVELNEKLKKRNKNLLNEIDEYKYNDKTSKTIRTGTKINEEISEEKSEENNNSCGEDNNDNFIKKFEMRRSINPITGRLRKYTARSTSIGLNRGTNFLSNKPFGKYMRHSYATTTTTSKILYKKKSKI